MKPEDLEQMLPLGISWAQQQERLILQFGVPLTHPQLELATKIGVRRPERVRLLPAKEIPLDSVPNLQGARELGLLMPDTQGLALGYGIYLHVSVWGDQKLVAHELTHNAQYERLGGIENFLRAYLKECLEVGYPNGALEQEAIHTAARLCP